MKVFSIAFAVLLLFFGATALAQQEKLDPTWLEYNQNMVEAFGNEDLDKAREFAKKALEYLKDNNLIETVEYATTLNNMGMVYYYAKDFPRASNYLGQALALRLRLLGPDHMDVAATYRNLAEIYRQQAVALLMEVERIQKLHE